MTRASVGYGPSNKVLCVRVGVVPHAGASVGEWQLPDHFICVNICDCMVRPANAYVNTLCLVVCQCLLRQLCRSSQAIDVAAQEDQDC